LYSVVTVIVVLLIECLGSQAKDTTAPVVDWSAHATASLIG
jgi:hypothetical protein